ncbi:MAG: polyprenyl synthetase family protein, partial [Methanoregulaceae archaeon]|nr:polyprenyl synthetase family protein [Methanoregulaceae archaeon]
MELTEYLDTNAAQIDRLIERYFGTTHDELSKASAHLLVAGGKRLRPAVVMLAADAAKRGSSSNVVPAAIALELTHSFTLIHDDIMDEDTARRGVPTVHTKWDEPTAILAGDVLYARAFEFICMSLASDNAKVRAVSMLARTCVEICEGQHMDISFSTRDDVDEGEYLEMVRKKTGVLYAAAAGIGAILAGGNPDRVNALYHYALNAGMAFQIKDDLIDIEADAGTSGKDRGSDLREGKQTLITIKAREKGLDLNRYKGKTLSDSEIEKVVA